jgi:nucleotide-binding universal stress UspA family protein
MWKKILWPSDFSAESNSSFPCAVALAEAFDAKLYMLHVMHPNSVNEPEALEDFPRITDLGREPRNPHARRGHGSHASGGKLAVARIYRYDKNPSNSILEFARHKAVKLVVMSNTAEGVNFAWWSLGKTADRVVKDAPCSVLVMRGVPDSPSEWKRPQFRHILLPLLIDDDAPKLMERLMPWVETFDSMLHVYPIGEPEKHPIPLPKIIESISDRADVMMFADSSRRSQNLLAFLVNNKIDLVALAPKTRAALSGYLLDDIVSRILRLTTSPVLVIR